MRSRQNRPADPARLGTGAGGKALRTAPDISVVPPRFHGAPLPEITPSSCAASVNPIEMPAPTEAARPTRNVVHELWVANAVANIGANVDTEPSINPASPG